LLKFEWHFYSNFRSTKAIISSVYAELF